MPTVRNVFIIGALALAGLPILNGFWSKELILEEGLLHGPLWAYAVMVFTAGLTALYTFRCVWMVFFGRPRTALHGHDAPPAMRFSLLVLAFGTLTSWLLAGPFAGILHRSLPWHEIETLSTGHLVLEILTAPATLIALLAVALGLAAWWWRDRLSGLSRALRGASSMAANSFGFEAINRAIIRTTQNSAEALRSTQTGSLNWNIFGILLGLAAVLIILAMGV
jgi:NADH-quinone oxidoreductase subunit L